MIFHEVPVLPFQKVGADILELNNKNYLVLVDYFSKYIELRNIDNKTAHEIIRVLKQIFSCHGIPQTFIADNVPFNSFEFKKFARE